MAGREKLKIGTELRKKVDKNMSIEEENLLENVWMKLEKRR